MKDNFRPLLRRLSVVLFWLFFIALAGLYFTNDFGIVDLQKTSIIVAVGVDYAEDEVQVTAQLALPKASQSGDNVEYTQIQGKGETVADALNEINAKTGYYPKLQFCKLILIGDSCKQNNLFQMLGCFYRKNYSELTALVAMCSGSAADMLGMKAAGNDPTSTAIQRVLSSELKKSANVSSVNLKDIAVSHFSESNSAYMPYVEANAAGTSQAGGDGDNVGGEAPGGQSGGQSGSSGSSSGGQSGGSGESGGGGEGGSSGSSKGQSGGEETVEFTARRTALFGDGKFVGILDDAQSFALDVLANEIRLAMLPCDAGGLHYTLGLKDVKGGLSLGFEDDKPKLKVSFSASAQIAGVKKPVDPKETAVDDKLTPEICEGAEKEIRRRMGSLLKTLGDTGCDALGVKKLLYINSGERFEKFKDSILSAAEVEYNISIRSQN